MGKHEKETPLANDRHTHTGEDNINTDRYKDASVWKMKLKGKSVPLQAWTGPEGSRKLRFPDFVTKAQDGGKVVSLTHRPPLHPGNTPGTRFC
jgi:hypothetical protein